MSKFNFISDVSNYENYFKIFVDEFVTWVCSEVRSSQNTVMLDVGANRGAITKILLDHIDKKTGIVIAIDAHPNWLTYFPYKDDPAVQTINIGCYSTKCVRRFIDEEQLTGSGFTGLSPVKAALDFKKLKSFDIEFDTLDNLITVDKTISFIKIDAESSDFEIILGARQLIQKHRPCILFEFSGQIFEKAHAHDRKDFFQFFKEINYNLFSVGLGESEEQIAMQWDTYSQGLKDIVAIPNEYINLI